VYGCIKLFAIPCDNDKVIGCARVSLPISLSLGGVCIASHCVSPWCLHTVKLVSLFQSPVPSIPCYDGSDYTPSISAPATPSPTPPPSVAGACTMSPDYTPPASPAPSVPPMEENLTPEPVEEPELHADPEREKEPKTQPTEVVAEPLAKSPRKRFRRQDSTVLTKIKKAPPQVVLAVDTKWYTRVPGTGEWLACTL